MGIHFASFGGKKKKRLKKAMNFFFFHFNADIIAVENEWFMFYSYIY